MNRANVHKRVDRFKSGRTKVSDEPLSGRPLESRVDELTCDNMRITVEMIVEEFK